MLTPHISGSTVFPLSPARSALQTPPFETDNISTAATRIDTISIPSRYHLDMSYTNPNPPPSGQKGPRGRPLDVADMNLNHSLASEHALQPELRATIAKMEFDATQSIKAVLEDIRINAAKSLDVHGDQIGGVVEIMDNDAANVRAVLAAINRIQDSTTSFAMSVMDATHSTGLNHLRDIAKACRNESGQSEENLEPTAPDHTPDTAMTEGIKHIAAPETQLRGEPDSANMVVRVVKETEFIHSPPLYFEIENTVQMGKLMDFCCENFWGGLDPHQLQFRTSKKALSCDMTAERVFGELLHVRYP